MGRTLGTLKRAFNRFLEHQFDHRLERTVLVPLEKRLIGHLSAVNLAPKTVIDVGIAEGTPWLYEAYASSKFILIDPTPQSLQSMQRWADHLDAEIFNVALGNVDSRARIKIRPEHSGSTFFEEVGEVEILEQVEVPVKRFDGLPLTIVRPSLMKIDAQGSELMILQGMGQKMKEIDCFVIETSLIATLHDGPEFADVCSYMSSNGFSLFDIVGILRRPLDDALAGVDAVFVPTTSPLRADRRWAK
jgi:FkbM family methyltransferase